MDKVEIKEIIQDLENVIFDFYNGNTYESMRDLENIVMTLKKEKGENHDG